MIKKYPSPILAFFGPEEFLQSYLEYIERENLIERLWRQDWTLWSQSPEGITNRLGWLEAPQKLVIHLPSINQFVSNFKTTKLSKALLVGMGGSSLAPKVLNNFFPSKPDYFSLEILDSTVPKEIILKEISCPPAKTIYLVSSKSGTTTETNCLFHYFFTRVLTELGEKEAPSHFMAITYPSTPLVTKAQTLGFAKIWLAEPNVGGRFSALTVFGLVPAALKGIDISELIESAQKMIIDCQKEKASQNPGAMLAAFLASVEALGRNKLLLYLEPSLEGLGEWIEQLVAESTGKLKKGLLPVIGQEELLPLINLTDAAFIALGTSESSFTQLMEILKETKTPSLWIVFNPQKDIGALFFLWEWAVALAASFFRLNPFDQPDVEKTKTITREILDELKKKGSLAPLKNQLPWNGLTLFTSEAYTSLADGLIDFLHQAKKADYLSLQVFLAADKETKSFFHLVVKELINKLRRPITLGWGPSYLHSTGQFHKGGRNKGFFLQFLATDENDLIIPENPGDKEGWLTFGVLKEVQARADYLALSSLGKKIIQLNLGRDSLESLKKLNKLINSL
ncbi:MAG: hypothetical protein N3B16_00205 [Candidatus Aminicenantes bacterium]|nr:hypothetical protein [Candidatus Aminicenantes bacterium]